MPGQGLTVWLGTKTLVVRLSMPPTLRIHERTPAGVGSRRAHPWRSHRERLVRFSPSTGGHRSDPLLATGRVLSRSHSNRRGVLRGRSTVAPGNDQPKSGLSTTPHPRCTVSHRHRPPQRPARLRLLPLRHGRGPDSSARGWSKTGLRPVLNTFELLGHLH